jgi:leucyl aminopeptidase
MNFELKSLSLANAGLAPADALLVFWPDTAGATVALDPTDSLQNWVNQALTHKDLEEGVGKVLQGYAVPGLKPRRVVLVRAGDGSARDARKAAVAAFAAAKHAALKHVAVWLGDAQAQTVSAVVQALADATYVYQTTKSKPAPQPAVKFTLGVVKSTAALQAACATAFATARGVALAKEWANRPGNHATPSRLAEAALLLGKERSISTEVLGPKEVAKLGMGAFLAVAKGSEEPLRFIVMKYQGAAKNQAPVVLVGKGITFDTGGISIKPAPEMDEMKFDMGGAASVLGTFEALAQLQPKINVVGIIPSCENMPDGRAVKPGDVVTSMSGQTIEILNTDAEGRLILCDALTYAERFKPRAVIDIATLTGACVIALGAVRAGLFSNTDALAQHLQQAGDAAQDPCWRMPLDDEYAEGLKSNFADMGNVAGRQAGSVTAAKFLQKFVGAWPWAHLDIAGVAWKSGATKGSTGRPVALLVRYLLDEAERLATSTATSAAAKPKAKRSVKA